VARNSTPPYSQLITVAGGLGGFVMVSRAADGTSITDFFVVRALRRTGVGRAAAGQVIAMVRGQWRITFQADNPGVEHFWRQVAADAVGQRWRQSEVASASGLPPDVCLTFDTSPAEPAAGRTPVSVRT
jgi:predicted acetyltransferase